MSQPETSSKRAQTHQEALYLGWGAGKGPAQSDRRRVVWCPLLRIHLCNPPARLVAVCLLQLQQDCGWEKRVEEGLRAPSAAAPSSRHQWRWRHQRRQRQRLCKLPWTGGQSGGQSGGRARTARLLPRPSHCYSLHAAAHPLQSSAGAAPAQNLLAFVSDAVPCTAPR